MNKVEEKNVEEQVMPLKGCHTVLTFCRHCQILAMRWCHDITLSGDDVRSVTFF